VVTVGRDERVKLVMERVICNNRGTIQFTLMVGTVQNVDSIPKAIVRGGLVGRGGAKEGVSLGIAGLQKSKGFETGVRVGVLVPKSLNSSPKLNRVNNSS
jgi:hypothetical protein